jgi:dihydrofolate synthase/folylpolyglutamate synthase
MTYSEAVQFLYNLRLFGAKFGLENTFKLAARAGNPQNQLRFIHVAGTNGKGSTCAMLESIYRAAGLRVGLFTSPHLVSFRERIQVNRELISKNEVIRLVEALQPMLKEFHNDHHPTFFEVVTVMALKFFAEQKCDLVIWETGLGGWTPQILSRRWPASLRTSPSTISNGLATHSPKSPLKKPASSSRVCRSSRRRMNRRR